MPSLQEIDTVYANVIQHMPLPEKIAYCEQLIDKTQSFLSKNNKFMDTRIKEKSLEIIASAQSELKKLMKNKFNLC